MKSLKIKFVDGDAGLQNPFADLGWSRRGCVTVLVENIPDDEPPAVTVLAIQNTVYMMNDNFWDHIDYKLDRRHCGRGAIYPRMRIAGTDDIAEILGLSSINAAANLCRSGRLPSARKGPRGWTARLEDVERYRDEEMAQGRRHPTKKQSENKRHNDES